MKNIIIVILMSVSLLFGCATAQLSCPTEDVYIAIGIGNQMVPIRIKKGFLDNSKNYKNQTEFDAWLEEQYAPQYVPDEAKNI